jgi:hypothetical protein
MRKREKEFEREKQDNRDQEKKTSHFENRDLRVSKVENRKFWNEKQTGISSNKSVTLATLDAS